MLSHVVKPCRPIICIKFLLEDKTQNCFPQKNCFRGTDAIAYDSFEDASFFEVELWIMMAIASVTWKDAEVAP